MIDAIAFTNTALRLDENLVYKSPISKVEFLALAIVAQRINGEYIKRGGKSDFIDEVDATDGETYQRFRKVAESNRFVMETVQQLDPNVLTPEVLEEAQTMLTNLEMDYMFKVLGDNMNDFENSIHQFISDTPDVTLDGSDFEPRSYAGIVAYIPAYVERENKQKEVQERSVTSTWLGDKGDTITAEIEIISKRAATAWAGYNVNAITTDGNRVSFFTGKENIANMAGVFTVSAKVKDCGTVWQDPDTKETRINYVKII